MNMGIIAEDDSDVAVIAQLTLALIEPRPMGFKKFVGDGCGKLRRKCGAWASNLVKRGCSWIIVVHDLDRFEEGELRKSLAEAVAPAGAKAYIILIPKHEIEAWLLYDPKAIAEAFNEREEATLPGDPETLVDPKRFLADLIWKQYRKRYMNTLHNAQIAKHIRVGLLSGSSSFAPHVLFMGEMKGKLRN